MAKSRDKIRCEKDFSVKRTKFSLAAKILQYLSVSVEIAPDDLKDLWGLLSWMMLAELALCNVYTTTTDAQYPATQYIADQQSINNWFLQLVDASGKLQPPASGNSKEGGKPSKSSESKDSSSENPVKNLKDMGDKLRKEIQNGILSPESKPAPKGAQSGKDASLDLLDGEDLAPGVAAVADELRVLIGQDSMD